MRFRVIAACWLALPTAAYSQITTQCQQIGQFTNCRTNTPQSYEPVDYGALGRQMERQNADSQRNLQNAIQAYRARKDAEAARKQAMVEQQNADMERERVQSGIASLSAKGQCQDAIQYAMANGRYDAVPAIKAACTPQ